MAVTSHGNHAAVILLSGGMDSAACALWASRAYSVESILAVTYTYGQPNADQEDIAAGSIAERLGLRRERARAMGLYGVRRLATAAPSLSGESPAFIPARNPWLLSMAANLGAVEWPGRALDLWIGACRDDAIGFADCRAPFLDSAAAMLSRALGTHVRIVAPLLGMRKTDLVAQATADPELLAVLADSWSCYRGNGCGECQPCRLRDDAFRANGLAAYAGKRAAILCGGDPHRERT